MSESGFNTLSFIFVLINIIPLSNYATFFALLVKSTSISVLNLPESGSISSLILLYLWEKYSHLQVSGGQSMIFFFFRLFFLSAPGISPGLFPSGKDVDFFSFIKDLLILLPFGSGDFCNKVNFLWVYDIVILYRRYQK